MNGKRTTAGLSCLVAALFLGISATAEGHDQNVDANRARALELWEDAVRAKGGRDRLQSVQNFLISSTINIEAPRGGATTETERLYALPGKAWLYEYTPHFDVSVEATVINIERNLCMVTLSPAGGDVPPLSPCLPTTWAERLIQDSVIYLMETKWVRPVPIRTRTERTGFKLVDVIETELGDLRVDFYLDPKTRLPIKLVTDDYNGISEFTQRMGLTVWLDDYVTINGIKMPGRVAREPKLPGHMLRRDIEYARYRFNVAYEETIFDHPVSKRVKASDWKP